MKPSNDSEAMSLILDGIMAKGVTLWFLYDGEVEEKVSTKEEAMDLLNNLDEAFLHVVEPDGTLGWIRFVMGNEPEEVVCDHTVNLSKYLDPITDPWWNCAQRLAAQAANPRGSGTEKLLTRYDIHDRLST